MRRSRKDDPEAIGRAAFEARCDMMREHGCLCCLINLDIGLHVTGFGIPEIHHLNEGGLPGGKRRGDRYTIPLCSYHHRGRFPRDALHLRLEKEQVVARYGPSWVDGTPLFRAVYPGDEALLAKIDGDPAEQT